jgi:hypothetical protein
MTREDRMLKLVLSDPDLCNYYEYSPEKYNTIQEALNSDDIVVNVIARIIRTIKDDDQSEQRKLYTEIFNELKNNLL